MKCSEITYRPLSEMELLPSNPRKISAKGFARLVDSIRTYGFWKHRPVTLSDRTGNLVVIAGNQRLKAAKKLKLKEVPTVIYSDLTEDEEKAIILRDNINNGEWNFEVLQMDEAWNDTDFEFAGLTFPEDVESKKPEKGRKQEEQDNEEQNQPDYLSEMLGDRLYDSDNEYDIPTLRTDRQPVSGLLLPFAGWGADTRAKKGISTYHFYVEDYRFTAIWNNPLQVLESGCTELVEPNLSLFDTTPVAYGLQLVYMKRWIARLWQECGARIYADLNVAQKFYKYNRLGIPDGYNAFATRGYADRQEYLKMEIQTARDISGLDKPNMIVYGGGEKIREICLQNNVLYVEQFMANRAKLIKKGGKQNG